MPHRRSILIFSLAVPLLFPPANRLDRRVVDTAEAGNPVSEATHGYVGADVITGVADGNAFRQARGYMRYALTTYDDTEVTVACTFVGGDSVPRNYDVIVEDSLIASRTFVSKTAAPTVVEIKVPFVLTKGRTNIAVIIRARGGPTPALHKLRSIQDHNEVDDVHLHTSSPAIAMTSPRSQNPFGVAR